MPLHPQRPGTLPTDGGFAVSKSVVTKRYVNRQPKYTDHYALSFRPQADGTFEIHAETRPHDPYRLVDECHIDLGGTKVCVRVGKEPRTFERAEAIAHAWMIGYSVYIRTGKFPRGSVRVDV
jgi:hypothetical protein